MANTVRFGLSNVTYATATYDGTDITYGDVKKLPGAVTLTLDASGDLTSFYADDIVYFASSTSNGYTGTLEVANVP